MSGISPKISADVGVHLNEGNDIGNAAQFVNAVK